MWLRSDLKKRGEQNFKKTYFYAIIVSLVLQLAVGFTVNIDLRDNIPTAQNEMINRILPKFVYYITVLLADNWKTTYALILFIMTLLVKLLVCFSLEIGVQKFYIAKPEEDRTLHCLFSSFFSGHYASHISIMFKRTLFIILWSFLFAIPGIIKSYEYRMIPYLLAKNEGMTSEEAFWRSKEMMNGQKWNVFVMDLSFLPWHILSLCTCNLLGIFFVRPYYDATNAELYLELSR